MFAGFEAVLGRQSDIGQFVKEPELDAAPPQYLVKRREDDVSHPGAHSPEQGAAIAEEHPQ